MLDSDFSWVRVIAALLLCLLLAVLIPWLMRGRRSFGTLRSKARDPQLGLVEQVRIGARANAYLLKVDARDVIVVVSSSGVAVTELSSREPRSHQGSPS